MAEVSLNAQEAVDAVKFIKERANEGLESVAFATQKCDGIAQVCNIPFLDKIHMIMEVSRLKEQQTVDACTEIDRITVEYAGEFGDFASDRGLDL